MLDRKWNETFAGLQAAGRIEPVAPRLASPSVPYLLRGLDLPDPIEDELIKLFGDDNWKIEMKAGEPLQIGSSEPAKPVETPAPVVVAAAPAAPLELTPANLDAFAETAP